MPTLTKELTSILTLAPNIGEKKGIENVFMGIVPQSTWRKNVPRIPGQDTLQFKGWEQCLQYNRKVMHIEYNKGHSKIIYDLVEIAKG